MIIELLSKQIPAYWNKIREAGIRSDGIEPTLREDYANALLVDLLAGKKSCVLSVGQDSQIKLIIIISILMHPLKKVKYLKVFNVYGVQKHNPEDWQILLEDFKALCVKYSCVGIETQASHDHIKRVLEQNGFKAFTTTMHYYL